MIVIDKVSNTTSPNNESVQSVDKFNAADDSIEKDHKNPQKAVPMVLIDKQLKAMLQNRKRRLKIRNLIVLLKTIFRKGPKATFTV